MAAPRLRRSLGLPLLVLYGLGTTIGAGIYALLGEVAARVGYDAPLAFAIAAALAGLSGASFAELAARLPRSAGEAVYVREGLGRRDLATLVGLAVALAGCVSAATVANAFVGYLGELVPVPRTPAIALFVSLLAGVAFWGVRESVTIAAVVTLIEVVGLLLVIGVAADDAWRALPAHGAAFAPPFDTSGWSALLGASLLAFYAFIGFEDLVNMAEETRDVRRTLPRAIFWTLGLTFVLYVVLAGVAVLAVPPAELGASDAPLARVFASGGGRAEWLAAIGVLAMLNGALVQIVMAARVFYGLADQGAIPRLLARIHPRTRTPGLATLLAAGLVLGLALWLPLAPLARATSLLTLAIFALVNLSLLGLKRRGPPPPGAFSVPATVPALGCAASAGLLGFELLRRLL